MLSAMRKDKQEARRRQLEYCDYILNYRNNPRYQNLELAADMANLHFESSSTTEDMHKHFLRHSRIRDIQINYLDRVKVMLDSPIAKISRLPQPFRWLYIKTGFTF